MTGTIMIYALAIGGGVVALGAGLLVTGWLIDRNRERQQLFGSGGRGERPTTWPPPEAAHARPGTGQMAAAAPSAELPMTGLPPAAAESMRPRTSQLTRPPAVAAAPWPPMPDPPASTDWEPRSLPELVQEHIGHGGDTSAAVESLWRKVDGQDLAARIRSGEL